MLLVKNDTYFMQQALNEAYKAYETGEVPVGAVVVCNNQIIARSHNQTQLLKDVTAHAEIIAITSAASYLDSKYLHDCHIYVTLEPCPMCASALAWAQISTIVYGTSDDKSGFMRFGKELLHPKTTLKFGIYHDKCTNILTKFFESKREKY